MKTNKTPLKLWFVVLAAVASFSCGNCYGPCDPDVQYPSPGTCPDPNAPAGSAGGKCYSLSGSCDEGLHCSSGTCLPCGGANEACCYNTNDCDVGVCDLESDSEDICTTTCGAVGQACCDDGECAPGARCINGTCADGPMACSGAITWWVGLYNTTTKCADLPNITVKAATQDEAAQCAAAMVPAGYTALPPQQTENPPQQYTGCAEGSPTFPNQTFGTQTFNAYGDAHSQVCLQSKCINCESVYFGECSQN